MDCPACYKYYRQPKILPCGHLLCRDCLVKQFSSGGHARCPLCQSVISNCSRLPDNTYEELADRFPTDQAMVAVVESALTLTQGKTCGLCSREAAMSLCLECCIMLCTSCLKLHGNLPLCRSHTVEIQPLLTPQILASSRRSFCPRHTDLQFELFCSNHGAPVCAACIASDHKECSVEKTLDDEVQKASDSLTDLYVLLSTIETHLLQNVGRIEKHVSDTVKYVHTALQETDEECDRLHLLVEAFRKRTKEKLEKSVNAIQDAASSGKVLLEQRRTDVTSHRQLVKRVAETVPVAALFDMTATLKKLVSDLNLDVALPESGKVIDMVTMAIDREKLAFLEKELEEFGRVTTVPAELGVQRTPFCFHSKHGKNIILSNNNLTAERVQGTWWGIVVSNQPMITNTLFEIQLDQVLSRPTHAMVTGIIGNSPTTFPLPKVFDHIPSAFIVWPTGFILNGQRRESNYGRALKDVTVGCRVGMLIDANRNVHLYVDGEDQGVAACDAPLLCWAVFRLCGQFKKATALPLTYMREQNFSSISTKSMWEDK